MNVFLIQDKDTGNFISSDSVFITEDEIIYCTHSGEAEGIEYNSTQQTAEKTLHNINLKLLKHNIKKDFQILEMRKSSILRGDFIKEYYPKII